MEILLFGYQLPNIKEAIPYSSISNTYRIHH